MGDTPGRVLEELVKFINNYMKSEPTISTQKFVSERSRIYMDSKQIIKHWAVLYDVYCQGWHEYDIAQW